MNDGYVLVPIFGLVSFVGAIVGLLYFEWYERHQREWRIQLERVRQVAIAETLARPKPIKIIKPHRLYNPTQARQPLRLSTLPVDANPKRSHDGIICIVIAVKCDGYA